MTEEAEDKKLKAVEEALGKPVAPELSENAWKIRTNLIVTSVIAIGVVLADLRIDAGSSVLGLKFAGSQTLFSALACYLFSLI